MNRTTLARRYAPLALLAAVQLFIIAVVPSNTPATVDSTGSGAAAGSQVPGEAAIEGEAGFTIDPATGQPIAAGPGGVAGVAGKATGATGAAGGPGAVAAGDTSHCVGGRQYDPKIYYYAPPCVGKSTGKNPGASYLGVTDKTIKVIKYEGKPNLAVDAILTSLNLNPTDEDVQTMVDAATKLINDKYELYGRKIEIKRVKGNCDTVPPDYDCLRGEMRGLVQREKPFAVLWLTTLASPAFEELSAQKVVNMGGYHFRDNFGVRNRPYHYDELMGGTTVAKNVAEWYCNRLHGFKAANAGETGTDPQSQNPPANDIRSRTRVLGVISTDDPENKNVVTEFKAELAKRCGARVAHEYYYAQDINRAEEQRTLGVAKMRESPESTTIMCFCDPVAPVFLFRTCQEQKYFPEHVVVGTAGMDTDVVAQAYDGTLNPGGHQWENAFGLGSQPKEKPLNSSAAADVEKYAGKDGKIAASYAAAPSDLAYYLSLAGMIQMAGPALTPASLEQGAFRMGARGGTAEILDPFLNLRRYGPGDYTAHSDMREIYFSRNKTSQYNDKAGAYVDLGAGRRFVPGSFQKGELILPPKATR